MCTVQYSMYRRECPWELNSKHHVCEKLSYVTVQASNPLKVTKSETNIFISHLAIILDLTPRYHGTGSQNPHGTHTPHEPMVKSHSTVQMRRGEVSCWKASSHCPPIDVLPTSRAMHLSITSLLILPPKQPSPIYQLHTVPLPCPKPHSVLHCTIHCTVHTDCH